MPSIPFQTITAGLLWTLGMLPYPLAAQQQLDCLIEPYRVVALTSPVKGILQTAAVERGDFVHTDQVLGKLRADVERIAVELARARLAMEEDAIKAKQASRDFGKLKQARHDKLYKKNMISSHERDEVTTEARLAELELAQAEANQRLQGLELEQAIANLELRTLRSPIEGVVMERLVAPGELVEDKPVFKLAQIDPLHVEVIVPVALFDAIKPGMQAEILPEAPVGGRYEAEVKIVDPIIDAASGTFGVRLELPNPEQKLPAGLGCQVRFQPASLAAIRRSQEDD